MISQATIEAVSESTLLSDLARSYFPLRKRGGQFWGCCPFHHEKSPSFSINDDKGLWKCWGCGKGGNLFRFVMDMERLSFPEAVEFLAARSGIPIEKQESEEDLKRDRIGRALNSARSYFFNCLLGGGGAEARAYLKSRGLCRKDCEDWDIGYCGESDIFDEAGEDAGLSYSNGKCRFANRITFGIRSESGALVGFSGRTMVGHPAKYLNTPETSVFNKGKLLYGLNKAKKQIMDLGYVVVVEGQIDAIKCHLAGIDNTVAPLGTGFTSSHCSTIKRLCGDAVLVFDGDKAGREAARKAFAGLSSMGVSVRAVFLGDGQDPDSFMSGGGDLKKAIAEAKSYPEALAETLSLDSIEDKEDALRRLGFALSCMGDGIRRDEMATNLAKKIKVRPSLLKKYILMGGGHALVPTESVDSDVQISESERDLLVYLLYCGKDRANGYDWSLAGNKSIALVMGADYEPSNPSSLASVVASLGSAVESAIAGMDCGDVEHIDIKAIYKSMLESEMRKVAGEVASGEKDVVALSRYLDTLKSL